MSATDTDGRTIAELAADLRAGRTYAAALAEAAIANHEAGDARFAAYKTWDPARFRAEAEVADRALAVGIDLGPLQGIPVSVKDLFGVRGYPTFAGAPRELPAVWRREGPVIRALRGQLAVVSGKTHTVQFAFGALGTNPHWGTPRNPWDAEAHRAPGGSSAGAGVSLWEGSALLALGTDTAGSVRMPASMTGTVGIKTTQGRWSTDGITPLSHTLDTPGVLARNVADAALAFSVIDPEASGDPARFLAEIEGAEIGDFRIGVCEAFFASCDPGVAEGVHAALAQLEAAGARVSRVDIPGLDEVDQIFRSGGLSAHEFASFIQDEFARLPCGHRPDGGRALRQDGSADRCRLSGPDTQDGGAVGGRPRGGGRRARRGRADGADHATEDRRRCGAQGVSEGEPDGGAEHDDGEPAGDVCCDDPCGA